VQLPHHNGGETTMDAAEVLLETRRFRVVRRRRQLPDGSWHQRETVDHPGAAVILPLLDDDRLCLIRNYRIAVDQELIELPAGTIDPPEDPLDTARRELLEETGYLTGKLEKLHEYWVSPGILRECMHFFVARELTPGQPRPERGEEIKAFVVSLTEALAMIDNGRIRDAKTIAGLLLYDRLRTHA
jgi:ADP-ribose pyrophosphatase